MMKLNYEHITAICQGGERTVKTGCGVKLYRFTEEQEALYRHRNIDFYMKSFAAAGIKLCFETDSSSLFLKVKVEEGSSRKYFSFDLFVNEEPVGYLDNYTNFVLPQNYTEIQLPLGTFCKKFELEKGIKKVCIYLPWSVSVEIQEVSIDDGAFVKAIKPTKKMLAFGDSITQGYDALRPSNCYVTKLAEALDAEVINKGIGGEIFFPAIAETKEEFNPDYITVAYGTNDWNSVTEESFKENCYKFFKTLNRNYPQAKIFALTPIWRKDNMEKRVFGRFDKVAENIINIVKEFNNITYISGDWLFPKDEKYFGDLRLHPNDIGFKYYYSKLYEYLSCYFNL